MKPLDIGYLTGSFIGILFYIRLGYGVWDEILLMSIILSIIISFIWGYFYIKKERQK